MKAWRVVRYGRPTAALSLDEVPVPEPGPGMLRVRVAGCALNLNDVDMCYGRYPTIHPELPFTLGMEVVGEVDAVGAGAERWAGRTVMTTPLGGIHGYAEYALASPDGAFEVPAQLAPGEAAAFFIPFHTAHLALHRRGRLQPGETLLVHAAAGGVGSAALQLGVAAGAHVIATCGGEEKAALCRELGAERVIDYRSEDFAAAVLEATNGRGADVICDLVGGDVTEASWRCIAREGRYLIAGFSGGIAAGERGLPPRPVAKGNFSLVGVMMAWVEAPDGALRDSGFLPFGRDVAEEIQTDLERLLAAGRIRPVVGRRASFERIPEALEDLGARKTVGRTVVDFG